MVAFKCSLWYLFWQARCSRTLILNNFKWEQFLFIKTLNGSNIYFSDIFCGRHAVPEHEEKRRGNVWAPAHSPTMAGKVQPWQVTSLSEAKQKLTPWPGVIWQLLVAMQVNHLKWHPVRGYYLRPTSQGAPVKSNYIPGGLFAIDRDFFEKLGTYDSGFDISFSIFMDFDIQGLTSGAQRTWNWASKPGCVEEPLRLSPAHMLATFLGGQPFSKWLNVSI